MTYDKEGRRQLGRIAAQIDTLVKNADREGREHFTSAELEQFRKLQVAFERQEELVAANEGPGGGPGGEQASAFRGARGGGQPAISDFCDLEDIGRSPRGRARERDPHARAFSAYLRGGVEGLDEEQRGTMRLAFYGHNGARILNAQSVGTGSQGGYTVPQSFSYQLEEAMKFFGGIVGVVGEFDTDDGRVFPWPTVNDTTNKGRLIGENQQTVETDVVFNQVVFNSYIGSSDICLVPLTLLQDSAFDIDALLARLLGTRLGRLKNYYCTVGTGTNQPMGIVPAAQAAGLIFTLPTGNTTGVTYPQLVALEHKVDPAYRASPSCVFMFNDAMLASIKLLVDGNNRPLWSPGLTASLQDGAAVMLDAPRPRILQYPYVVNNDMAVPAANAYSVVFGAMDRFKVRKVKPGVTVIRLVERFADYLQQGFIAYERFDSQLIDAGTHPLCAMQQSAT